MRKDRSLEQIVFPVPCVCQFLTQESKDKVLQRTECNEQGSKVDDFFKQISGLHEEMVCQKDLRGEFVSVVRVCVLSCDLSLSLPLSLSLSLSLSLPPPPPPLHTDNPTQYWIARQMSTWSVLTFYFAVAINALVGLFYPFNKDKDFFGM